MTAGPGVPGGYVIRDAVEDDVEDLLDISRQVFGAWVDRTESFLRPLRPQFRMTETLVATDPAGRIVSTVTWATLPWRVRGGAVPLATLEDVSTAPEHRGRGLAGALVREAQRRQEQAGALVQAVDGIPRYYGRFGYEYGLERRGGRSVPLHRLGPSAADPPYAARDATEADLSLLVEADAARLDRSLVGCARPPDLLLRELVGVPGAAPVRRHWIVLHSGGIPRGLVGCDEHVRGERVRVTILERLGGAPWPLVTRSALAAVALWAERAPRRPSSNDPPRSVLVECGRSHPAYVVADELFDETVSPMVLALRVPDLAAFLTALAGPLAATLDAGSLSGMDGEVVLGTAGQAARITVRDGRVAAGAAPDAEPDVWLPPWALVSLLFGQRALAELAGFSPDVRTGPHDARRLVAHLFPPGPSHPWGLSG